jgi:hypothetical protein
LVFGPIIPTTSAVMNFEPQGKYVWYSLSNYDGVSTGLGRLDLSTFTEPLVAARASDVMATGQGMVLSVSSFGTRRVFTVAGVGVFRETAIKVPSGQIASGKIAYGIGDDKVAMFLDVRTQPLDGTLGALVSAGGADPIVLDTFTQRGMTKPPTPLNVQQQRAEYFELTLVLNYQPDTPALGPVLNRWTLRAYAAPNRSSTFTLPLLFHEELIDHMGQDMYMEPLGERQRFETLLKSQALVSYQEGDQAYTVLVDDLIWVPIKRTLNSHTYSGTLVVQLKEMSA